ncbi:MAG: ABC transporter permease subunit, partial [Ignavibacteriales bacterium]
MELLITQVINGLQLGTIYALIALGYTMVYGIIRLINFAHGDLIMVGGYVAYFCIIGLKMTLAPALVA